MAHPAALVFVGSLDGKVCALEARTGRKAWEFATGGGLYSSPAVAEGLVFIGSDDDKVYALEAWKARKAWQASTVTRRVRLWRQQLPAWMARK
jgi:outer membrane protein assembly factor BamB